MRFLIIAFAAILAGCNHNPTVPEVVKVPVTVPCQVKTPPQPNFQFGTLTPEDTIWVKVRVLLSDRQLAIAYQTELEAALAACKK